MCHYWNGHRIWRKKRAHCIEYSIESAKIVHHCFPLTCVEQTTFRCGKPQLGLAKHTMLAWKQCSWWHAGISELMYLHHNKKITQENIHNSIGFPAGTVTWWTQSCYINCMDVFKQSVDLALRDTVSIDPLSAGSKVGLDHLWGLFQADVFCDSVLLTLL